MAHIRSYAADDGSHRRLYRSMDRYATLASQNDAQEVQVWHTRNNHLAGRLNGLSAHNSITMARRRIEEEKAVVEQMIRLYCRKSEGHGELCPSCRELLDYAHRRLDRCRYGEDKPTCKKCPTHCYRPEMKERIRTVMRWAGPRMIIYHPLASIRHLLREIQFTES